MGRDEAIDLAWHSELRARLLPMGADFTTAAGWHRWRTLERLSEIESPPAYRAYLQLGRFRNALVLDELQRRPSPALHALAEALGIRYASRSCKPRGARIGIP
jgi:hypothetical protein